VRGAASSQADEGGAGTTIDTPLAAGSMSSERFAYHATLVQRRPAAGAGAH
jgi:hypothetical protein